MIKANAMRFPLVLMLPLAALAICRSEARAEECVDTARNNPAFASSYGAPAKPCPPTVAAPPKAQKPAAGKSADAGKSAIKPATDRDHATVTSTPNGTLIKYGETTVCVSGSISVDVSTGNGVRRTGGADRRESWCE
jgi:hypothetical protein